MKRTISILLILVLFVSLLLQVPTIAKEYPQTRYEAEAAVLSGVQTNTDHAGYTGTGFVDHFDAKGVLSSSLSILQKREIIPS